MDELGQGQRVQVIEEASTPPPRRTRRKTGRAVGFRHGQHQIEDGPVVLVEFDDETLGRRWIERNLLIELPDRRRDRLVKFLRKLFG